jgi:hypothetical protein
MTSLELNWDLSGGIRIVVVQIDEMSSATFSKYYELIRGFSLVDLRALTQSAKKASSDELTAHRSRQVRWRLFARVRSTIRTAQEAKIQFDYVDGAHFQQSVWHELYLSRRVLGVVGVFHCRSG